VAVATQSRQGARKALGVIVLLMAGMIMALRTSWAWDTACTLARRSLPDLLGLDVGIGQCELDPLGQKIVVRGLSLFEPGSDTPLLAADMAEVQLGLTRPFSGKLALDLVRVQRPRVALDLSRPSEAAREGPAPCVLAPLERLRISRLALTGAQVRLALPGGRRVEVMDLDVGWKERWGVAEFDVEARRGVVGLGPGGGELGLGRLVLSGGLDVDAASLDLSRAEVALEDVSVSLSGRVEELCDPQLALDAQVFLPLRTLTQAKLLPQSASGHVWSRLTVNGRPAAPRVAVEVSANNLAYERFGPTSLTARLHYEGERIQLEKFSVPVGNGRVEVEGTVRLTPSLPVELEVETYEASFGRILAQAGVEGSWVDFPATVTGRLSGALLPRPQLSGEVELRTGRFVLATRAFDAPEQKGLTLLAFERGRVQTQVKVLSDRVSFTGAQVESGRSRARADVTLFYDPARGLEVRGQGDMDLSDYGAVAGLPWEGTGGVEFTVVGPLADVRVEAGLSLRDFKFWGFGLGVVQGKVTYEDLVLGLPAISGQKGRTQYFGKGALTFGPSLHARAEVSVPQGRTEDLLDIIAGLHPNIAVMQGTVAGLASGRVEIDSPVDRFEGLAAFEFRNTTYYGRRMGDGSSRLLFVDGKEMVLERTTLVGPLGKSWVEGTFTFSGGLDYRFGGEELSLAELVGPELAQRMGVRGTLALTGTVGGNSNLPTVDATLTSPRVMFADRDLGALHLTGKMVGRGLEIFGKPFQDADGYVEVKVREPFPFDGSVVLKLPEFRPLLPVSGVTQGMSGSLAGTLSAQGNFRNLEAVQLTAMVDQLTLSRGSFRGANEGPINLKYSGGRLEVESFAFRGPDTELSVAGWVGPRTLDFNVRGNLDARVVETLLPGELERSGGRVAFHAQATGSLDRPSLVGEAAVADFRLALRGRPVALRNVSGLATFTEQGVLLKGFRGLLNEGRVTASGEITLKQLQPDKLSLVAELEDVTYRFADDLPIMASGVLQLTGTPNAMLLAGDVDILRLRYQKGLELEGMLKNLGRRSVLPTTADRPREFLTYDVRVHLKDVRVDNNLARARLLGDLRLTGTNVRPGFLGRVEADEGSQAFFRNNQFVISHAQVDFQDRYGVDLVFDVRAQTQVREYTLKLHAFGRPADPQVILSSEPALAEGDVLSLLTLGVTSTDRETAASASAGLAAEALFNVSGLDRQVKRFLPKNAVLRDLSFQISTTYNDATRQAEPTAQLESKILSDQLKIGMTQPVSGRGTRARAEYRFDNRLSAQAQWDNENSEAAFGNLGLELKLSWEVE
jgi:translocation and assembly module TamB